MQQIRSNRELYAYLTGLGVQRELEEYLRALLGVGIAFGPREPSATEVAAMFAAAATAEPVEIDPAWLGRPPSWQEPRPRGKTCFEQILVEQIVDLQRMRASGQLADSNRYFGLDAPGGSRWYNFDPSSYLECGTTGSVGGWDGDEEMELVTPPESVDEDDAGRRSFGWEGLCDLLICGRCYE